MREILFRGKRKDNGEWIYGFYIKSVVANSPFAYITTGLASEPVKVWSGTVGQYTGLTDKNGTKIFEGDIINATTTDGKYTNIASVGIGNCKETSDDGTTAFAVYNTFFSDGYYVLPTNKKYKNLTEVIGNIHDNPYLIRE